MKKLLTFLTLLLPLCLMAQAPPVLRQALTTNTAPVNPTNPGQIPVWTGTSWIFTTNLPGIIATGLVSGDLLWTNDNGIYRPTAYPTNFFLDPRVADGASADAMVLNTSNRLENFNSHLFSLRNKNTNFFRVSYLGGMEVGNGNSINDFWGAAGSGETIVSVRDTRWGDPNLNDLLMAAVIGDDEYSQQDFFQTADQILWTHRVTWGSGIDQQANLLFQMGPQTNVLSLDYSNAVMWVVNPTVHDTASAVAYHFDTANNLVTADARLVNVLNKGVPKAWVRYDGSLVTTGSVVTTVGITNNGTYQHSVGAFAGALFVSSNANGVAYWTTNVNNIGVTNLSVYNNVIFNGSVVSNFNRDLIWTNDGIVTRPTGFGGSPNLALRWGTNSGTAYASSNVALGTVGFGSNAVAAGRWSTVAGGVLNEIRTNTLMSFIGGGTNNVIHSNSLAVTIGGGELNVVSNTSPWAFIGGGARNQIAQGADSSAIAGGQDNIINASITQGFVGGGAGNTLQNDADRSAIGGGNNNRVGTIGASPAATDSGVFAGSGNLIHAGPVHVIAGGLGNRIGSSAGGTATIKGNAIGGGTTNTIATGDPTGSSSNCVIAGGWMNNIGNGNNFVVVSGGRFNGTEDSDESVIGGGFNNIIGNAADAGTIGGGHFNQIASGTNSWIGGGFSNTMSGADLAIIVAGRLNRIQSSGDYGFSLGHSNNVNAFSAGTIGNRATNALAFSIDIAPNGDTNKATFTASNTVFRTSVATVPTAVITLTADNQVVDATQRSYVQLASDSAVAGDRTFLLTGTNVVQGAHLTLEWTGTNAGELVDDSAQSGAGTHRLSATWTPTQYDTLSLIFNGTDWVETARATN